MKDNSTLMFFPCNPAEFLEQMRLVIREELDKNIPKKEPTGTISEVSGLVVKPIFTIAEVCTLFEISKPTIYEWVKYGKLKPKKIRGRVYFLQADIQLLLKSK